MAELQKQKLSGNHDEEAVQSSPGVTSSPVARCCLNAAVMLELADIGERNAEKRIRLQKANRGQAEFLRTAAEVADDLLAMTQLLERSLVYEIAKSKREGDDEGANMKRLTLVQVRAVLAKATGTPGVDRTGDAASEPLS
jgi:hypothetical protein